MKILVTGATGKVGSEVAKALLQHPVEVVIAVRDEKKAEAIFGKQVKVRLFNAYEPQTYEEALNGIDKLFLLGTEGHDSVLSWKKIVDTAIVKGIKHIAFLSSLGAEFTIDRPHRLVELHLHQSGVKYTILRPNFFFQNFSTDEATSISRGEIFLPCGDGKTSFVDTRDIAAAAAVELLKPHAESNTLNIAGGESLDHFEIAAILSEVLKKKVTYLNPSNEEYADDLRKNGTSEAGIKGLLWLYDSVKEGKWDLVSNDFENVVGRKPISFKQFAEDYKFNWAGKSIES